MAYQSSCATLLSIPPPHIALGMMPSNIVPSPGLISGHAVMFAAAHRQQEHQLPHQQLPLSSQLISSAEQSQSSTPTTATAAATTHEGKAETTVDQWTYRLIHRPRAEHKQKRNMKIYDNGKSLPVSYIGITDQM